MCIHLFNIIIFPNTLENDLAVRTIWRAISMSFIIFIISKIVWSIWFNLSAITLSYISIDHSFKYLTALSAQVSGQAIYLLCWFHYLTNINTVLANILPKLINIIINHYSDIWIFNYFINLQRSNSHPSFVRVWKGTYFRSRVKHFL